MIEEDIVDAWATCPEDIQDANDRSKKYFFGQAIF
jgi:hypothetical protein